MEEEQVNIFDNLNLYKPEENSINTKENLEKHLAATGGKVMTRFPPEPNGYLHIGHSKAMYINFGYANRKGGHCYLRFDDTNPSKEKQEYIDSIIEDVTWLGHKPYKITYSSDYFDQLLDFAFKLIKKDKAYVCELSAEQMRADRATGTESPHRNRPVEENIELFNKMISGECDEGVYALRLKMDMNSDNHNMRDPVAYRVLHQHHPRTGDKYKVYPTYEYSHCVVDSLENITHSLCSMEFQSKNEAYQWILKELDVYRPNQIEYTRLNMTHVMLSKRKLIKLIEEGVVDGWDDPRLPTIKGLRRRGYTPESINSFCDELGINIGGSSGIVYYGRLENSIRNHLNPTVLRKMAVMDPIRVIIQNRKGEPLVEAEAKDYPLMKDASPTRKIKVGSVVYIDRSDFSHNPGKKYFRMKVGGIVRLKYAFPVKCTGYAIRDDGTDETIFAEALYDYEGKIKGTISWVSAEDCIEAEIREYDYLFPEQMEDDSKWLDHINPKSKHISKALVESSLAKTNPGDRYQFERFGFYVTDKDTTNDKIVFNKIVDLKESKYK